MLPRHHKSGRYDMLTFRISALAAGLFLVACAPAPMPVPAPSDQTLPEIRMAYDSYPSVLFDAVPLTCDDPEQRIQRRPGGIVECRSLLPPEATAGVILRYQGTVDDLPESVVRFVASKSTQGHEIAISYFLEVPQKAGGAIHVVYPHPGIDRKLRDLLTLTGGRPIQ